MKSVWSCCFGLCIAGLLVLGAGCAPPKPQSSGASSENESAGDEVSEGSGSNTTSNMTSNLTLGTETPVAETP